MRRHTLWLLSVVILGLWAAPASAQRVYVKSVGSGTVNVAVIDADPASPDFHTLLTTMTIGEQTQVGVPKGGLALTPDGTRLYFVEGSQHRGALGDFGLPGRPFAPKGGKETSNG